MDIKSKRKALRMFSNGLYVLTSRSGDQYGAATVSWVSQTSFKPPLVMAAIKAGGNIFQCLAESRIAAIHVLGHDQQDIAQKFFSRTQATYPDTINDEPVMAGKTSAPILQNSPAYVECQVHQIIENGGDHTIVVLEVVEANCQQQVQPLTVADSPWEYGG